MRKWLVAVLVVLAVGADAQEKKEEKKTDPDAAVLQGLTRGGPIMYGKDYSESGIYKRIGNGNFRLLTIGEMQVYIEKARKCFDATDRENQLITAALKDKVNSSQDESRPWGAFVLPESVTNIWRESSFTNRDQQAVAQQAAAQRRNVRMHEDLCLIDAKQYRQTMSFYHKVMNTSIYRALPSQKNDADAEGFSNSLLAAEPPDPKDVRMVCDKVYKNCRKSENKAEAFMGQHQRRVKLLLTIEARRQNLHGS